MNIRQKKFGIAALVAVVLIFVVIWRIETVSDRVLTTRYTLPERPLALPVKNGDAQKGEKLARVYGCFACHGEALTGRVAFSGPLGTKLVAPNLTTLTHRLSDAELAMAIRFGIKPDGTSLFAMPAGALVKSSDSDIAAIIAYLRTLPRKPGTVPKTAWGFIGRAMLAMGLLPAEAASVDRSLRGPLYTPTDPIARGHYIARAHCATCHGDDLTGDTIVASPDLRFSIKHYTPAAFARFFATGQGQIGHGTKVMTPMIRSRFRFLTKADVRGIYAYLNAPKPKS